MQKIQGRGETLTMEHKSKRPRWLGLAKVLSLLLAAALCVAGLTQAFAATVTSPLAELSMNSKSSLIPGTTNRYYSGKWATADGTVIGYAESARTDYDTSNTTPRTGTLEIKNITSGDILLTFDWTTEESDIGSSSAQGSVSVAGNGERTGRFNSTLKSGATITVTVISPVVNYNNLPKGTEVPRTTITLTNFEVSSATDSSITLQSSTDGSYTVSTADSAETMVAVGAADTTYGFMSTDGITVSAAANAGKEFYMWWDPTTGIPYSTHATVKLLPGKGQTIQPIFVNKGELVQNFLVKNNMADEYFIYWEDAMRMVAANASAGEKTVLLKADYVLPTDITGHSGTYVTLVDGVAAYRLPDGVTLVVPDDTESTAYDTVKNLNTEPGPSTAFRTLTVPEKVSLTVPATSKLVVNAVQGAKNGASSMGRIIGDYGQMEVKGTVDIYGTLYARGFVTGSGQVTAESGANIYQLMQIQDWRGGSVTFNMYNYLMAINMYSFENIMANMTYEGGSSLSVQACIAASGTCFAVDVPAMTDGTHGASIFILNKDGQIKTAYDKEHDRLDIRMTKGTVKMQYLELNMSMGKDEAGKDQGLKINSANYPLAVNDSMSITVEKGATLQTDYDLKFLPGTSVTVEEGAKMVVSESSHLYFYSLKSYNTGYANDQYRTRLNYATIEQAGKIVPPTADAKLEVRGTLELSGAIMQSTDGESGLTPYASAQVIVNQTPATEGAVNECYKNGETKFGKWKNAGDGSSKYYYTVVDNWCAIKGRMAESADDGTNGAFTPFDEVGTYKPVNINGTLYWYQYRVDYTYQRDAGIAETVTIPSSEITYISKSTANHAVASVGGQRFVAVAGTAEPAGVEVKAGEASVNNLADGAEDVALANVTGKTTVTLTVRPYTYRVTWEEYASADAAAANNTFAHYVTGDTDSATWSEQPTLTIRGQENAAATVVEATKTVNISDITNDAIIKVNVDYTSYPVKVRVVIPDASITTNDGAQIGVNIIDLPKEQFTAVPNAEYLYSQTYTADKATGIIKEGIEMTQYFKMISGGLSTMGSKFGMELTGVAESGYYVIDKVQVTAGNATVAPDFRSSTLLVSDVKSAVEVTVTLKHKDYMAIFAINEGSPLWYRIPGNTTTRPDGALKDDVTTDAAYFDAGEAVVLLNTQVRGGSNCGFKYMFTGSTDSAATVAEDKLTFDTTGVTGDVTVNASMTYYDFIATLETKDGKVLKNIYMQDYVSDVQFDKQGKWNSYVRYTADFDGVHYLNTTAPLPYDEAEKYTDQSIYSWMSYTYTFDGTVSLNEMENGKLYTVSQTTIPNGAATQDIDSLEVSAANAEDGGKTTVTVRAKSYYDSSTTKQTAITENCVVTVDPVAYDHIVTFEDRSGKQLAKQYVAGDTATYTAAANTVVTAVDAGNCTVTNTGTAVTVSGLTGDTTIRLTTKAYSNRIVWNIEDAEGTMHSAYQFIYAAGGSSPTQAALLGEDVSDLAAITVEGTSAKLTAADKHVVYQSVQYEGTTAQQQTATSVSVSAFASGTVTAQVLPYDHTVTFTIDGNTPEVQYVRENKDVVHGMTVYLGAGEGRVITSYAATGGTVTVSGSSGESPKVSDGWTVINVTDINSDVAVALTTAAYRYQVLWVINYPNGTSDALPRHYVTETAASWTASEGYTINTASVPNENVTFAIDSDTKTVTLTENQSVLPTTTVKATVTLKSAVTHLITYTVNSGTATVADPTDGAWTYTPDPNYEITGAVVKGDADVIVTNLRTSLTITGITGKPITVAITTAQTTTEPAAPEGEAVALWGDMSYQYYRCASVYRWNGTDANNGQWTPADTFAWRHSAGSRSYTVGGKSYTVPNGSILLLNNTDKPVTYTVQLVPNTSKEALLVGMTWTASSGTTALTQENLIVVTVPARSNILVSGEMHTKDSVTVPNDLSGVDVGHITVGTATVSEN